MGPLLHVLQYCIRIVAHACMPMGMNRKKRYGLSIHRPTWPILRCGCCKLVQSSRCVNLSQVSGALLRPFCTCSHAQSVSAKHTLE